MGKILILVGIFITIVGIVLLFAGNKLNWLGHLPGDIRIESEHVKFYFPVTTMILISILLSAILAIIRRWF
ncbi:MAG: DUF2905 domain-containing protein [Microbacter sp.]